jgi:AcrR family transcriptional regulator
MSPKDGQKSREAVLAAAEDLFARKGYDPTSLQEIGEGAGVSRGLPNYFFGTKEALYNEVVARVFARAQEALGPVYEEAAEGDPAEVVAHLIDGYLNFFAADPNFVRIVQREALRGGGSVSDALRGPVLDEALAGIKIIAAPLGLDPAHLLILIVSVCWFPYAHGETLLDTLGLDPHTPEFREQHRRNVVELLLGSHGGRRAGRVA